MAYTVALIVSLAVIAGVVVARQNADVIVFTFAAKSGDHFSRFLHSANKLNYNVKVLESNGGADGKPALLKNALEEYKVFQDLVVLFVDSHDMLLLATPDDLTEKFNSIGAKVLYSAQAELANSSYEEYFPLGKENEKRYIHSGGFIGYASDVYTMLHEAVEIYGSYCDLEKLTEIFFNPMRRSTLGMKLDSGSSIFQSLEITSEDVILDFQSTSTTLLHNSKTLTYPAVLLGGIETSLNFSYLANYVPNRWSADGGCSECMENQIALTDLKTEEYPTVFVAIFIEFPTPFIEEFFVKIRDLTYPKSQIDLFIHKGIEMHDIVISSFIASHSSEYRSISLHSVATAETEIAARKLSFDEFLAKPRDYYLAVDGLVQLEKASALELLIARNRSFVAPLLVRPGKMWSNFWGALDQTGYYTRSEDYVDIINYNRMGLWNVPFVMNIYMIKGTHVELLAGVKSTDVVDVEMEICKTLRDNGVFMYLDNMLYYGHLIDADNFETTHLHNDMYEIFSNRYAWEKKYITEEFFTYLYDLPLEKIEQPCPDVFWMPLASPTFCRHLIEEMEHYGKWSGGTNEDIRLAGGYENVPTVDIHTNQIGWEKQWLFILKEYIRPLAAKVYAGYQSEAHAIMNFVVRYKPTEMNRLVPHHDASTYTINLALNTPNVDYQGGGPKFLRYNCSVTDTVLGWMLMHPGRLTHYHEGLPVTNGTRYIMISFIDP